MNTAHHFRHLPTFHNFLSKEGPPSPKCLRRGVKINLSLQFGRLLIGLCVCSFEHLPVSIFRIYRLIIEVKHKSQNALFLLFPVYLQRKLDNRGRKLSYTCPASTLPPSSISSFPTRHSFSTLILNVLTLSDEFVTSRK